ncbi:helix-hairpin-helix domain-containing protein [Planococcus sp. YIM B11945]|uniref:helix-hairpin-helix domain-containing protein n=1 Tax=Planococcus sp. YIM B11945 TaxID=3435410 RepID=UPI003D7E4B9C
MNFSQLQNKIGWLLIPAAVILILAIYFLVPQDEPDAVPAASLDLIQAESPQQTEPQPQEVQIPDFVMVDVKGQVANPGVYELPIDARMQDAIDAAGGFSEKADNRAINLAQKLQDEMAIYVPAQGEEIVMPAAPGVSSDSPGASSDATVNLNSATDTELMTLPGIGPSKAAAIIAYRTDNGNFQTVEDLKEVTGIGEKTFEKLKELISVK